MSLPEPVRTQIESLIQRHPVLLFMKGNREQPQCGFSAQVVQILDRLVPDYETFDVFSDSDVREGIKEFASWPTIPQLYVRGEFQGGCDIIRELYESGELHTLLGVTREAPELPKIQITPAAAQAIEQARASSGNGDLHIGIDARFRYQLGFGPPQPGEIEVEAAGMKIWLSPESAARASGLTLDVAQTPQGPRFRIENPNEPTLQKLSPTQLKALRDSGAELELIDVRTPEERAQASIEGSRLLDDATLNALLELPRDRALVFFCHHGGRSQAAAEEFARRGFTNVHNLVGGIDAWSQEVDASVPRY